MSFLAQTNNILVQKLRLVNDFPLLFPQTQIPPFLIILAEIEHSKASRRNDRNKTRLKLEQNTFKIQSNLNVDAKLLRFKFIFFLFDSWLVYILQVKSRKRKERSRFHFRLG